MLDPEERFALAQVMADIMHRRPRFDLSHPYFIKAYQDEGIVLRLHLQLVRGILNQHVSTVGLKNITCEKRWKTWPEVKIISSFHCGSRSWVFEGGMYSMFVCKLIRIVEIQAQLQSSKEVSNPNSI